MELISREDVIKCIDEMIVVENPKDVFGKVVQGIKDGIIKNIEDIPTIENRPKGEWVKESDYKVMGDGYMWDCSECGNRVYVDSDGLFPNYCEDCGADMRGEE